METLNFLQIALYKASPVNHITIVSVSSVATRHAQKDIRSELPFQICVNVVSHKLYVSPVSSLSQSLLSLPNRAETN